MGNQSPEEKREYNRRRWERWNAANPGVAAKRMKQWKKDNPERTKTHFRTALLKKYGLTIEQFDAMLAAQGGKCKLCRKERLPHEREWQIDHCHNSNVVRGILCYNCNVGLGHFKDDIDLLAAAILYLEHSNGGD